MYLPTLSVPVPLPVESKRVESPTRLLEVPTTPLMPVAPEANVTAPTPLFQFALAAT